MLINLVYEHVKVGVFNFKLIHRVYSFFADSRAYNLVAIEPIEILLYMGLCLKFVIIVVDFLVK